MEKSQELTGIINQLYELTGRLEEMYPGRHFMPDGHLVGSIGEVFASERYGISLFSASCETHDGIAPDGRLVQIRATQRRAIGISGEPDYLLVLSIDEKGRLEEAYNGPGKPVWQLIINRKRPKTGQYQVSLAWLRLLNAVVSPEDRIEDTTDTSSFSHGLDAWRNTASGQPIGYAANAVQVADAIERRMGRWRLGGTQGAADRVVITPRCSS